MQEKSKQKIVIVSHCFLNEAAKLKNQDERMQLSERISKRAFLKKMLNDDVEIIQLPCPEVILYGTNRWGNALSQLDTPFFRQECRRMLTPIVLQLQEYSNQPDHYEFLGILGIDGSPSCGVNFSFDGDWGGEISGSFTSPPALVKVKKPGVMMAVLKDMLLEYHLPMNLYSLESYPDKVSSSSYDFLDIPINSNSKKRAASLPKSKFTLKKEAHMSGKNLDLL